MPAFVRQFLIAAALFGLNVALVYPLFTGDLTQYPRSIESAFLSDAKFIFDEYPNIGWYPYWYLGFPFHLSYTLLLPYLLALIHLIFRYISIPQAYRMTTALMYVLSPVTLFLFVRYLTRRDLSASLSAIAYTLSPPFLYGFYRYAPWGYYEFGAPWSLVVMMIYGEGPHIFGLTIIPIAALLFLRALRSPSHSRSVIAALSFSIVALVNLIALYALLFVVIIILLPEFILGEKKQKLKAAFYTIVVAYGLSSFQYDASFIMASAAVGIPRELVGFPWLAAIIGMIVAFPLLMLLISNLARKLAREGQLEQWIISLLWVGVFFSLVFFSHYLNIPLAPQYHRYIPELNLGIAFLFGLISTWIYDRLRNLRLGHARANISAALPRAFILILLILVACSSSPFVRTSRIITQPSPNFTNWPEYVVANWLTANGNGQRVYATGTIAFWLNVFSNIPQLRGGADQGATNPWWSHVSHQVNTGEDGSLAVLWFKALNIKYVVVDYPNASTAYKDYVHPEKFEKLLPLRYHASGVSIFEVPLRHPELVQVVNFARIERLEPIRSVLDRENLSAYIDLIENPETSAKYSYEIESPDSIRIKVQNSTRASAVLVKMTYDEGWRAYLRGGEVRPAPVGPYFMLIYPNMEEAYEIQLVFTKKSSEVAAYAITVFTLVYIMAWPLLRRRIFTPFRKGKTDIKQSS